MIKCYLCFTCYKFHPEMKGISGEEFEAGDNVCLQEKCLRKGQPLEAGYVCEVCGVIYPVSEQHSHN